VITVDNDRGKDALSLRHLSLCKIHALEKHTSLVTSQEAFNILMFS